MTATVGGNLNTNTDATVTTYTLNSVTPTIIGTVKGPTERIFFRVDLDPAMTDIDVFIRLYPAAQDTLKRGIVLTRATLGNTNIISIFWEMPPNEKCLGEISAITRLGTIDIHVTEF